MRFLGGDADGEFVREGLHGAGRAAFDGAGDFGSIGEALELGGHVGEARVLVAEGGFDFFFEGAGQISTR